MPRRSILSAAERESLLALPDTKDDLIRHYTFSDTDLSIIRQRRGPANRLGFATQLCYLRFPGVILGVDEPPFPPLLKLVADQLKVSVESWDEYGQREQTRREHLVELQTVFGFQPFTTSHYRQAVQLLTELAMQTDKGIVLASALIEHLRRQSVILPALNTLADLPQVQAEHFRVPDPSQLQRPHAAHPPRILLLYGSVRARSFSRLLVEEAARLLQAMGAETRIFNPSGLPLHDDAPDTHPKVQELRALTLWSEGMVWCSPERHGAMTSIMKAQIDWIPLAAGAVRPTQGKTLAVMQVCGGSQSFNAVNQMRVLGRWMRMVTIPNQSSVAKAFQEFDDNDRMKPSSYHDRVVDVMEELVKFTWLTRDVSPYLVDRYSERKESAEELMRRVNLSKVV